MSLERAIYQRSYVIFIAFFLFMMFAFWLTYFTRILEQDNYRMHMHGAALLLWCILLIVQPWLIRQKKFAQHRMLGKFSYFLIPVFLFTTIDLLHYRIAGQSGTMITYFVALVVNALIAFTIFYLLAIWHRKRPTTHARYMICTVFPLVTPVSDRIIHIHFPSILKYLPTIEGNPIAPVIGFAIADLILLALCIWDWRAHKKVTVFPVALGVMLTYHFSVLNFHKFGMWKSFSLWFTGAE
jgi:hypothetical protein